VVRSRKVSARYFQDSSCGQPFPGDPGDVIARYATLDEAGR
jgi:hypothetical protein